MSRNAGFAELAKQFEAMNKKLQKQDFDEFCRNVAKELAARLLAKVIKRTPVGKYPKGSGKMGGTLRRGWTAKTESEAASGGNSDAKSYANALPITKSGNAYEIEIINPVRYASYVEYGHRRDGGIPFQLPSGQWRRTSEGWTKGKFMLTKSEIEVQKWADGNLEKKIAQYLGEVLNGK